MNNAGNQPLWVSHSSLSDYLKCPKAYFLKYIYRDPVTNHKISIANPNLTLGKVVHDVIEEIAQLPSDQRFIKDLIAIYHEKWFNYSGRQGGFRDIDQEMEFKDRGRDMIQRIIDNPGPLLHKAVRLKSTDDLPPRYVFEQEDNILLCGRVDWLEYLEKSNSLNIIDFKTGLSAEKSDSFQLAIYCLLVSNLLRYPVSMVSYWYLETSDVPIEMPLPDLIKSYESILEIAKKIKKAKESNDFKCPKGECIECRQLDIIIKGNATYVGMSDYQDVYIIEPPAGINTTHFPERLSD